MSIYGNSVGNYIKEKDPTISDWAKATQKPDYTAEEVGADAAGSSNAALNAANLYTDTQIASKQNVITGTEGQFVVIGADGTPTVKTLPIAEEMSF